MSSKTSHALLMLSGIVGSIVLSTLTTNIVNNVYTMPVLENRITALERSSKEQFERMDARIAVQESINNTLQARLLSEIGDMKQTLGRLEGQLEMLTRRADAQ